MNNKVYFDNEEECKSFFSETVIENSPGHKERELYFVSNCKKAGFIKKFVFFIYNKEFFIFSQRCPPVLLFNLFYGIFYAVFDREITHQLGKLNYLFITHFKFIAFLSLFYFIKTK